MLLRAFDETPLPPSNVSIMDRFDFVEGLSGSRGNDILRGDDATSVDLRLLNNGNDSVLRNFDLINGLRGGNPNDIFTPAVTEWAEGNIILGGAGSDLIEARGGDDIVDGDLKLDVRLMVTDGLGTPIATAYSMHGELFAVDANGNPVAGPGGFQPMPLGPNQEYATLSEAVFGGVVNPGNIEIVREIIDESNAGDFDTAEYSDVRANYTIETTNGNPAGPIGDGNGDGYITVSHNAAGADGVDLVRNIERLQFADQSINLAAGNNLATGAPAIVDAISGLPVANPFDGQELQAALGTIADLDGLSNAIFTFNWQFEEEPGSGIFVDFEVVNGSGEVGPLEGEVITVPPEAVGFALRVIARFNDDAGVFETVVSAPTNAVANTAIAPATTGDDIIVGTILGDIIDGLAGNDIIQGLAGNDQLFANIGDDELFGGPDNDLLVVGFDQNGVPVAPAGNNILDGGTGFDSAQFNGNIGDGTNGDFIFSFTPEGGLEVVSTGPLEEEHAVTSIEQFIFNDRNGINAVTLAEARAFVAADTARTAGDDLIVGTAGNDAGAAANQLRGLGGNDTIFGQAGDDDIRGNAGDDLLIGGLGNDIIRGGGGDDTILWEANPVLDDGRDVVNGGGNTALIGDTFVINGNDTDETFTVWAVADAITAGFYSAAERDAPFNNPIQIVITRNGNTNADIIAELRGIEEIVINGHGGADSFNAVGNFNASSLFTDTITINGSEGDDTVDLNNIESGHRILFRSNGGNDTILGELRPQDVIELAPGLARTDYNDPDYDPNTGLWTLTQIGGGHSISYQGASDMPEPSFTSSETEEFEISQDDAHELLNLVRGLPSDNLDDDTDHATGIRDLEGTGNNTANPDFGSADQPFIRLTEARYGEFDPSIGNNKVNPIFDGLDSREISNILGAQEEGLPKADAETSIFFMAFGQYFDHGLDFLPKGGNGILEIGTDPLDDPADLTRGTVDSIVDGVPQHLNKASPFVDQNQAYGSNELVGQFLRESVKLDPNDPHGTAGARLLSGVPDPSNTEFNLLPTLRELIKHHWEMDTLFVDNSLPGGQQSFRDYFPGLVDGNGDINEAMVADLNGDFMGSGFTLVGDANPFINILDHYVAGDLRANENYTLTSIHTVWARNHNFHVEKLMEAGFAGSPAELFEAAKIINEVEYQRVVFDEFADVLLGGLEGNGEHGFDEYKPDVDASISHEFAAAAYRFGHSLIGETIQILDENGQPKQVSLVDVFLNPTNDNEAFTQPLPPGYQPQPGYEQIGVDPTIGGILEQQSEEVDFNLVDAVRNDLVRIRADLFAFNVSRGWDVGLGSLNQIRKDLLESDDPYVQEAIELSGENLTPYSSWEDFKNRNGLSNAVIAQFMAAYPDLVLNGQAEIDAFAAANPDIELTGAGNNIVKGIDRVDFWVGGLAEEHINDGVVGTTFWVVLHEQLDRLQEGDRFYYLDRADDFDFYDFVESEGFAGIIERNTGLEGLSDEIFLVSNPEDDTNQDGDDQDQNDNQGDDQNNDQDNAGDTGDGDITDIPIPDGATSDVAVTLTGTNESDTLVGHNGNDVLAGLGSADTIISGKGDDTVSGGDGDDQIVTNEGNDLVLAGDGDDLVITGAGDDTVFGSSGNDHILTGDDNDVVTAGADDDFVNTGAGDDIVYSILNDGNDVYDAGEGLNDVFDFSALSDNVQVDLGAGQFGSATGAQIGSDTLSGFEHVVGGAGDDTITANNAQNDLAGGQGEDVFVFNTVASADGDHITDFTTGDKIDLTSIASSFNFGGTGEFELLSSGSSFTAAGQLIVSQDGDNLKLEGNVDNNTEADFSILISGKSSLDQSDFS
jgi:Ca2+-binding RTX toxin-like protein